MAFLSRIAMLVGFGAAMVASAPAQTQTTEVTSAPSPDADALANQLRLLAQNPRDGDALITAGELATRLGDFAAADAFFTRADRVLPGNPRLIAGRAALLVHQEKPGEALRLFSQAEAAGYDLTGDLADRGLAYDLIGDQPRAQRDYARALRGAGDDETTRRFALSLAISGKRDAALDLLDPLVRRSDRAAWRVRSFVLAMTGDVPGAQNIATSMLPVGMATGLQHFFEILPTLGPVDKAFAVHFGELRASPERLADARSAPVLAPLPPDPVVKPPVVALAANDDRPARGKRRRSDRTPPPVATAPVEVAVVRPALPSPPHEEPPVEPPLAPPVDLASLRQPKIVPEASTKVLPTAPDIVEPVSRGTPERPSETVAEAPRVTAPPVAAPPLRNDAAPAVSAPVATAAPPPHRTKPAAVKPVRSDDALLASIVGDLASAQEPVSPKSASSAAGRTDKLAKTKAVDVPEDCAPLPKARASKGRKAAPVPTAKRGKGAKSAASAASGCPVDAADAKPGKKGKDDPAKKEPSRIWVQVAGGAEERSLAKAWAAAKAKAPAAFKGKTGWSTPLKATNRVLTGPFKTRAEAQSFVNLVAKSGISAFVFESEAGQAITKLGAP